jgi:hypothetical protein
MAPAAATLRDPYPAAFSPDFHSCETATTTRNTGPSLFSIAKTHALPAFCTKWLRQPAQNPVTCLWTACTWLKTKPDKATRFLLTLKLEGVQKDRSLTVS